MVYVNPTLLSTTLNVNGCDILIKRNEQNGLKIYDPTMCCL